VLSQGSVSNFKRINLIRESHSAFPPGYFFAFCEVGLPEDSGRVLASVSSGAATVTSQRTVGALAAQCNFFDWFAY